MTSPTRDIAIFDLDGTLIDSDEALIQPFVVLGVARDAVTFGHVLDQECERLGISVEAYVAAYDTEVVQPYEGVEAMLSELGRWGIASNKLAEAGRLELARLGWKPEVALFVEAFGGPKHLGPVLAAMDVPAERVVYIGDTEHDRRVAREAGVPFGLAAWNPRAEPAPGDVVLQAPADVLDLLAR